MIPQGEKNYLTCKVCFFPLKINEEGLYFDNQLNKVEYNMTSIYFSAIKIHHIFFTRIEAKTCILIDIFK